MKGCLASHNLGANEGQVREAIRKFVYLAREFIIVLREGTLFVWFTAAEVVSILEPYACGWGLRHYTLFLSRQSIFLMQNKSILLFRIFSFNLK